MNSDCNRVEPFVHFMILGEHSIFNSYQLIDTKIKTSLNNHLYAASPKLQHKLTTAVNHWQDVMVEGDLNNWMASGQLKQCQR